MLHIGQAPIVSLQRDRQHGQDCPRAHNEFFVPPRWMALCIDTWIFADFDRSCIHYTEI